ncbi:MAG: alpha/beta hydrolase [Firmicutes bacterium]|nr:alpha/beta hydrolase [Bacillota bacterium]MCM1477356.1 alpha/beta hydrolase [Bacteroides sp.]
MPQLFTTLLVCLLSVTSTAAAGFAGWWSTNVEGIPITVHLTDTPEGLKGVLYSPTQTADSIIIDRISAKADTLSLHSSAIKASFKGVRKNDLISGHFRQGGMRVQVSLSKSAEESAKMQRLQTPMPPLQYFTGEVRVPIDSTYLAGTLTLPVNGMPAGTVVFITGSGTQDRDETIAGHKPFAVIADMLSRAGWATLRCDDRGAAGSAAAKPLISYTDMANDVLAQINFVNSQPQLAGKPVGLLGHSQGGNIAFVTAANSPEQVGFIVALATPGVKGSEILVRQNEMLIGPYLTPAISERLHALFSLIASDKPAADIRAEAATLATGLIPPAQIDNTLNVMLSDAYREIVRHDPAAFMARVKCPVLAINGNNDMQVDASQNLPAIVAAIPGAVTKSYPGINHLMQPCTAPTLNYAASNITVAPEILKDIVEFLLTLQ